MIGVVKSAELLRREKEFVKRIQNMEYDSYMCIDFVLSKYYKKFSEDWIIMVKLINISDGITINKEIYKIKFHINGQISCTCKDYELRAKNLKITCKHIIFILEKYNDLNYSILLENGFILNKHLLEQYENIVENALQYTRCRYCLNIIDKCNDIENICEVCKYMVARQSPIEKFQ